MRRILGACAFVVALGILLAVLSPSPALSDDGLTSLVNQTYGARVQDASLHDLAHQRAQFQVEYSGGVCDADALTHEGLITAETLACNQSGPARAVEQWQGSPAHDAILSDTSLNTIGCGSALGSDGSTFYACVLVAGEPVEVARTPNPTPVGASPTAGATNEPLVTQANTPEPLPLPNTATR